MPNKKEPAFHALRLQDLILQVRLGCELPERASPQEVRVQIEFRFNQTPTAYWTDQLVDTVCYAQISESVRELCEAKEYRLIEALSRDIYESVVSLANSKAALRITVHKVRPPVPSLAGGSWYICGDF